MESRQSSSSSHHRAISRRRNPASLSCCLPFLLLLGLSHMVVMTQGYPMILEVAENSERCMKFNIPEDDEAHMVFLALPSPASEEDLKEDPKWDEHQRQLEEHFMGQMLALTKATGKRTLPIEEPSEELSKIMSAFMHDLDGELKTGCRIVIRDPESSASRTMETFWFTPVVLNHLSKFLRGNKEKADDEDNPLSGYSICIKNDNEEMPLAIVIDSVIASVFADSEDEDSKDTPAKAVFESSHLTPLAEQLGESISAAQSVLKEMNYMEKREARMRKTADSINSRVQYFSYISVIVLLLVTYVQVSYLKRYFRKKKLL